VSLLTLAVALLLGHVCEFPLGDLAVDHSEAGEAHDHGDSLHAASCEAATSAPTGSLLVLDGGVHRVATAAVRLDLGATAPPPPPAPSPPIALFVLHLALLI
jgi:hypothetical protein